MNHAVVFLSINNEPQCVLLLCLSSKFITYAPSFILGKLYLEETPYPFPALKTTFSVNIFPNIDTLKVPDIMPRNLPSCFSISSFTVSLTPLINTT